MSKRLLILSPFFYPEIISTGKYNTELVKAFLGHDVEIDVITSHPLYPDWKPKKSNAILNGVNIYRGGSRLKYPRSAVLRRLVLEMWFLWHSLWTILMLRHKYNIIIPVFPPNIYMLIINFIISKSTIKVGVIHDLQGIMAGSTNTSWRRLIAKFIFNIERMAINKCDNLICLSHSMRKILVDKYGIAAEKCKVHYPFPTLELSKENTNYLQAILSDEVVNVVYSGALGEKQKPRELINILETLASARDDVVCHVFSRGPVFDEIVNKQNNTKSVSKVNYHDLVSTEQLEELYERSSMQIIPQAEGVGAGAFPSKLPNLIQAGVPVFVICDADSELASVVNQLPIGKTVHTWDVNVIVREITQFIEELAGSSHDEYRKLNQQFVDAHFGIEKLVNEIINK